ncbi:MAG: PHP domain-containing protein, partial [Ruminococcaceae bacterium]|nr:PHP domain-containing protein [Oscillospiraceae bacterium]
MKKYIISPKLNWYRANMHCHTTVSDGSLTPEQVKEEYKKMGYSIVAYTDHEIIREHNDLTDD